jgi:HTH-type transcriptional regulator/antitoxin HigA
MERLEAIFDAAPNTAAGDELELLSLLIDNYEKEHCPIKLPDPIEAIKFRMEQLGYKTTDLAAVIGYNSHASEVLNRKRKLSLSMMRRLHTQMRIPAEVLMQEYE